MFRFSEEKRKNPHISRAEFFVVHLRLSCYLSVSIFLEFKHAASRWFLSKNKASFNRFSYCRLLLSFFYVCITVYGYSLIIKQFSLKIFEAKQKKVASPINIHQLIFEQIPILYWCCSFMIASLNFYKLFLLVELTLYFNANPDPVCVWDVMLSLFDDVF